MAGIYDRHIEDELKQSYIDYAMSVIVGRALPDVRDGLKPVQRRIVYSMYESGNTYDKPYKKSARVVGDVLGKYHPHGDASVYDALVRMAQDFVMRYPLVDGHGNFGSMDGDPPAAMRYTEVRLTRLADYLTDDLDKETVNWTPNFDGSLEEPEVLPAVFPQLLVNGASGIAVGVSTSIPPHNIGEVIDATLCLLRDPGVSVRELMKFVKGPDFPTGGEIVNDRELPEIYERGKGTIKIRGRAYFEEGRAHKGELIIYEIPYMVNKAELVTEIAELVRLKKLSGVDEVRDESNRHGVRIVLELKKGASPGHILSQLYDQTSLEVTYGINMVALKDGMPVQLGLKDALQSFIEFRKEVVTRRTRYLLDKALHRQEVLQGIAKALDYIDLVIEIIRGSETTDEALAKLMQQVGLTQIQAEAVLETRLKSLVHMEKSKIFDELDKLGQQIAEYHEILSSEAKLLDVISAELQKVKQAFADDRRTAIGATRPQMKETTSGVVYIELLDSGVVRRSKSEPQSRDHIAVDASDFVVFLTNFGKVFAISAYEIPESQKGTALSNIFALASDEKIIAMARPDDDLVAITERGKGKRFRIDLSKIPSRGGYYFLLSPDDRVAVVGPYAEELVVVTAQGRGMRINGESIPERGLKTGGVKAVRVATDDKVVGFVPASREYIITMTENAYMKKTMIADVPRRGRGSLGVRIHKVNDKTGPVIGISASEEILYRAGREWRKISAEEIPGSSRATMGVKILRTTVNRLF